MLELWLGAGAVHRVRFAISPAEEVLGAVQTAAVPRRQVVHGGWARETGRLLAGLGVGELVAVVTGDGYFPDFLSPQAEGPATTFAEQVGRVRDTADAEVERELEMTFAGRAWPSGLPGQPGAARELLAGQLEVCWRELVLPIWARVRDVLAADIEYRARRYADGGVAGVFADLHARVRQRGDAVLVSSAHRERICVDQRGLLLVPKVLGWPSVGVMMMPPWQTAIVYPARGSAMLWESASMGGSALAGVVGRTKALLLVELGEAASTTVLARRLSLSAGTVSEHLGALRAGGLVTAHRVGRSVRYQVSELGRALVDPGLFP